MAFLWRDTAIHPKIFFVDATAGPAFLIWALHMSWWTFYVSATIILFLAVLPYFGLTPRKLWHLFLMQIVARRTIQCGHPAWRYARRFRY
jgi:hypothetical protein